MTLSKSVMKSYSTDTSGLFQSYIRDIFTKCCLYLTNIQHIILSKSRTFCDIYFLEGFPKFEQLLIRISQGVTFSLGEILLKTYF